MIRISKNKTMKTSFQILDHLLIVELTKQLISMKSKLMQQKIKK